MSEFDGQIAVVTGAGRGIGFAVAQRLASEGASIVVNDLDKTVCEEAAAAIVAAGGRAIAVVGDVTALDLPSRMVAAAHDAFGGLDILVNNAGWVEVAPIRDMDPARWSKMLAIHLDAAFRMLQAVGGDFVARHRAESAAKEPRQRKIVNVSSRAGTNGVAGSIHYGTAKAGVIGMTKSAALEWGRYGINVNAVAFGVVDTRLTAADPAAPKFGESTLEVTEFPRESFEQAMLRTPLGRSGTTAEAAGAVRFLCSGDADYVTGHVLMCTGGS